jgi:hypothetical protein
MDRVSKNDILKIWDYKNRVWIRKVDLNSLLRRYEEFKSDLEKVPNKKVNLILGEKSLSQFQLRRRGA